MRASDLHDVGSTLRARRSVRHFLDVAVERAVIDALVQEAAWAPSGGNAQPWAVTAVSPPATRQVLDLFEWPMWNALLPRVIDNLRRIDARGSARDLRQIASERIACDVIVSGAPWMLLVWATHEPVSADAIEATRAHLGDVPRACVPTEHQLATMTGPVDRGVVDASVAGFAYALTLAAHARDLATCIQHGWLAFRDELAALHPPPPEATLASVVLVGYPDPSKIFGPDRVPRRPVAIEWR